MHAADPAGRECADPGRERGDHRGRDRRRGPAALGKGDGQAWSGGLPHGSVWRGGQSLELRLAEPDQQSTVAHGHGGRHRPGCLANRGLGGGGDLDVLRVWQPVADERRLERHDGPAFRQGDGDLRGDDQAIAHGLCGRGRWDERVATPEA